MRQSVNVAEKLVDDRDELAELQWALAGLSTECKRVLTLRKIYGWEQERIASYLGIERHAVEDDLRVCIQSIAKYYDR